MTRLQFARTFAAAMAVSGCLAAPAVAEPYLVFLRDGAVRAVDVQSIGERGIVAAPLDAERTPGMSAAPETIPLMACLAMVQWRNGDLSDVAMRPAVRRTEGLVELRTGERIPGVLGVGRGAAVAEDAFQWMHARFGAIDLVLDDLDTMVMRMEADPRPIPLDDGDRVMLLNGDRVDGFVVSLGTSIGIERTGAAGAGVDRLDLPAGRVAAVRLVGGDAEPGAARAWFTDGTVLDIDSITVKDGGGMRIVGPRLDAEPPLLGLRHLAAVVFDTRRLVPLASVDTASVEPIGPRHFTPAPAPLEPRAAADLGPIELRGPVSVTWDLPDGSRRFAATAVMPDSARTWGDLELIVFDGREERLRRTINGDSPMVTIDVPLSGVEQRLTIRLEAGKWGPVMDRIELRAPRVLVD